MSLDRYHAASPCEVVKDHRAGVGQPERPARRGRLLPRGNLSAAMPTGKLYHPRAPDRSDGLPWRLSSDPELRRPQSWQAGFAPAVAPRNLERSIACLAAGQAETLAAVTTRLAGCRVSTARRAKRDSHSLALSRTAGAHNSTSTDSRQSGWPRESMQKCR